MTPGLISRRTRGPEDEEGINTDRPAPDKKRIKSARAADEWRFEKEKTKEQRATTRVRTPALAGMSDQIR
ncbi:hypothetical protein KSK55_06685 [Methanospirillum purgamenti]|uniref:Uncharacterized protein n=1 Tax=Methanospirillum hungatei TaxID=2203 RepID=A0A8F5VQN8_METHU|nr:hypothetical protein [Methanospirillum hungatei]QXO96050.1 hypothetical protein KSK55_06685 [Methanospirillum hungatei]